MTAGLHGNEPAGLAAIDRVVSGLAPLAGRVRGEVVALSGNRAALARNVRFVDRDLNRRWHDRGLEAAAAGTDATAEAREQRELLDQFEQLFAGAAGPVVFFDLHSTSGIGAPFSVIADTLRNRRIALALGIPIILGLEETLDASMLGYLTERGHTGVAVEGGEHRDPRTIDNLVAAAWLGLCAAGLLAPTDVPDLDRHRSQLAAVTRGLPRVVEIHHHHLVRDGDGFAMEPGFRSFQPVTRGQIVARSRRGPIAAPSSGRMLLPRYQGQGEDGFFLARDVTRAELELAHWARRLQLERVALRLPAVQAHPERRNHVVVDPRWPGAGTAARLLRYLGYRRRVDSRGALILARRRPHPVTPDPLAVVQARFKNR
jgi:succinylglutamate desuccinylase